MRLAAQPQPDSGVGRSVAPRIEVALWLALLAAFSPVIAEFLRGLGSDFAPRTSLLSPLLLTLCLLRGRGVRGASGRDGLALLAAGGALELAGLFAGAWTIALLGLPVAFAGMARLLGRPSLPVALLGFGIAPVPDSVLSFHSPVPESTLLAGVCALVRGLGAELSCTGPTAIANTHVLELYGADVGLPLAVVLTELGWFAALWQGLDWRSALRRALLFASATVVIQPLALAVALVVLAAGSEDLARGWLEHGPWLGCTAATFLWLRASRAR